MRTCFAAKQSFSKRAVGVRLLPTSVDHLSEIPVGVGFLFLLKWEQVCASELLLQFSSSDLD